MSAANAEPMIGVLNAHTVFRLPPCEAAISASAGRRAWLERLSPKPKIATENRIRAGAGAAMGYPRFGMLDLLKLLSGLHVGVLRSHAAREAEIAFPSLECVIERIRMLAGSRRCRPDQFKVQCYRDPPGDLVLKSKQILGIAVEPLSPISERWFRHR